MVGDRVDNSPCPPFFILVIVDTQKSIIEEKLESLQEKFDNSKVKEVANIFNEYFGEDFVDVKYVSDSIKNHILSFNKVGNFLGLLCNLLNEGENIRIVYGPNNIIIDSKTYLKEIASKSMEEFPEELLPILDTYWESHITMGTNYIIVRFPFVTVTNENNKSINIQELYARVSLKIDGTMIGRFELIRSYYPLDQWNSDYCHSHISHISTEWLEPCTGTGPINSTMGRLHNAYNENVWGLFCYELDKFVRVESLAGTPYKRLESVGLVSDMPVMLPSLQGSQKLKGEIISDELAKDFIRTLIEEIELKVSFINGVYDLGEPLENFWIKASRIFAKWYNKKYKEGKVTADLKTLLSKKIVSKYIIREGKVYAPRTVNRRNIAAYQGYELFTFKGKDVKMVIDESIKDLTNNETYLLSMRFISKLIRSILIIINYNYGRQEETTTEETQLEGRTIYI